MTIDTTYRSFKNSCSKLIGFTVSKVMYTDIANPFADQESCYRTIYPKMNSAKSGVALIDAAGRELVITVKERICCCELDVRMPSFSSMPQQSWEGSQNRLWKPVQGQKISRVIVHWCKTGLDFSNPGQAIFYTYPQAVELEFENKGKIIISVAELTCDGNTEAVRGTCNLLLSSNEELALATGMIAKGKTTAGSYTREELKNTFLSQFTSFGANILS